MAEAPSCHDLHITAAGLERTCITDLSFSVSVRCSRVAGWEVWAMHGKVSGGLEPALVGGEYAGPAHPLRLDVGGVIICDSFAAAEDA